MSGLALPDAFVRTVTGAFTGGVGWLAELPAILEACCKRWNLTMAGVPFPLSYHYVVPVLQNGSVPAVLKLGVPGVGRQSEALSLRAFSGQGAVRLLDADDTLGALLLERVFPGHTLSALADEPQAAQIAGTIMRQLWTAAYDPADFRALSSWTSGLTQLRAHFGGSTGPLPGEFVQRAEDLRERLLASTSETVLLHADLHHFNLLQNLNNQWQAIDPKGIIGDAAYEPSAFLLNPAPSICLDAALQQKRLEILARTANLSRRRILDWAFVQAVLSAWWTIEDGGSDWQFSIACAQLFLTLDG